MSQRWFRAVGSCIPRGFSRHFILNLLKGGPRTGKEIIDHATERSGGAWKPSPGLIYPLLGRLLDEGLVEEAEDGRYALTKEGERTAEDIDRIGESIRKQLDVILRLGNVGRFVTMDMLERVTAMGMAVSSNVADMTAEEVRRYRKFLQDELEKIDAAGDGAQDGKGGGGGGGKSKEIKVE